MIFENRLQAGRLLAEKVAWFGKYKPVVLGLSRGGIPVGYEIAKRLEVPLEIIVVRKIGSPENKEFGIGALAEEHTQIFEKELSKPKHKSFAVMKKHFKAYVNDFPGAKELRIKLMETENATGVRKIIDDFLKKME